MIIPPTIQERETVLKKWQYVIDSVASISSWTSGHELAFLAEIASQSKYICEIGSYHGKSAKVMALANPECRILCIDNCENEEVERTFGDNLKEQIASGHVVFIKGTSGCLEDTPAPLMFQACFLDAGHLEADLEADIKHILPHMKSGGVITGHDWRPNDMNDGVNRAVIKAFGMPNVFESIWWVRIT